MSPSKDLISDPLLRKFEVAALLGVQPRTLERWLAAGRFPAAMQVGGSSHCLRWRRSTVERYLNKLADDAARKSR